MKAYKVTITSAYYVEAKDEKDAERIALAETIKNPNNDYVVVEVDDTGDDIRRCSECNEEMFEGYCIDGGAEYYCSDECLYQNNTKEEVKAMEIGEDWSDSYWTEWED